MKLFTRVAYVVLTAVLALSLSAPASAQDSKSAPLARQLAAALDAAKLDSIAAKDPEGADVFAAALYFPGMQLLVVSGKYSVPQLLTARINSKEYRDVYLDLNGAAFGCCFKRDLEVYALSRREFGDDFRVEVHPLLRGN